MAIRAAVMGLPNTGKSFSRTKIKKGENCFVISPSSKFTFLRDSSTGKPVEQFDLSIGEVKGLNQVAAKLGAKSKHDAITGLVQGGFPPNVTPDITGNYMVVRELAKVLDYLKFIDKYMPHIKVVFLTDFTHWISETIASAKFMSRTSGGQAFARFWDLAADLLNNIFISIESLERKDLVVITEFHSQMNQDDEKNDGFYDVFLPAGKMLNKSFLPKSYFDFLMHTHVEPYEVDEEGRDNEATRYKFVVVKKEPYDGRMAGMFATKTVNGMIPNDMQMVLETLGDFIGQKLV